MKKVPDVSVQCNVSLYSVQLSRASDLCRWFSSLYLCLLHTMSIGFDAWMVPCIAGICWRHGVMVSSVGLINEVNQHRARLVLGWVTVVGWNTTLLYL